MKKALTKNQRYLALIITVILTVTIYFPTFQNEFTNYDDDRLITENYLIRDLSAENIQQMFTEYYDNLYQPITLLSWAIEYQLVGYDHWLYHLNNLLLHLLTSWLVFLMIRKLFNDDYLAIFTTVLFAIHPMHTESVAWLSERKDVLLGVFFFSALLSYIRYLDKRDWKFFILSLLLFLLSLGVKGQAVTLAVTLIAVDYLKGRSLFSKSVILEKIPFFLIALIFGLVALGGHGAINENSQVGINLTTIERLSSASYAYLLSFIKLLIPLNLSAFYPYPDDILNETKSWYTTLLLIIPLILFLFWYFYKKQKRVYLFGLAFFTFNIVLVLKIFPSQIGIFMMADRYTYISSIGVFIILYYLIDKVNLNRKLLLFFTFIYISGLSIYAFERNKTWKNSIALWSDVQKKYPDNAWVLNMKGKAYTSENRYDAAIKTFRQTINIEPKMYIAHYNLGNAYHKKGKLEKAYHSYENVLKIQQDFSPAWLNAGSVLLKTKQYGQALYAMNKAIKYDSTYSEAYYNKGYLKLLEGNKQAAYELFTKSIDYNAYFFPAYRNRAILLMELKKFRKAIDDFDRAIQIRGNDPKLLELRGDCKMRLND